MVLFTKLRWLSRISYDIKSVITLQRTQIPIHVHAIYFRCGPHRDSSNDDPIRYGKVV